MINAIETVVCNWLRNFSVRIGRVGVHYYTERQAVSPIRYLGWWEWDRQCEGVKFLFNMPSGRQPINVMSLSKQWSHSHPWKIKIINSYQQTTNRRESQITTMPICIVLVTTFSPLNAQLRKFLVTLFYSLGQYRYKCLTK